MPAKPPAGKKTQNPLHAAMDAMGPPPPSRGSDGGLATGCGLLVFIFALFLCCGGGGSGLVVPDGISRGSPAAVGRDRGAPERGGAPGEGKLGKRSGGRKSP